MTKFSVQVSREDGHPIPEALVFSAFRAAYMAWNSLGQLSQSVKVIRVVFEGPRVSLKAVLNCGLEDFEASAWMHRSILEDTQARESDERYLAEGLAREIKEATEDQARSLSQKVGHIRFLLRPDKNT